MNKYTGLAPGYFKSKKQSAFKLDKRNFEINLPPDEKDNGSPEETSKPRKGFWQRLKMYCKNTTLHGLRYAGDPQLTYGERIFWLISFCLALSLAMYYIKDIYTRWRSSPVIISFSPYDIDLSTIPFPAVTICNVNQVKKTEADRILANGSIMERVLLDDTCTTNANHSDEIDWNFQQDFLIRVGSSCSEILKACQWGSDRINCSDIFENELTDEGLCCVFNRLPPKYIFRNWTATKGLNETYPDDVFDWNPETGFYGILNESVPRRPLGDGGNLGLTVFLDAQVDNYYCSSTSGTGFKVGLSSPGQINKIADYGFLVGPGQETRVSIEPVVIESTPALKKIAVNKRQCFFSEERPLKYYRVYSQKNCRSECEANIIFDQCGCAPYYLPRNTSTNLCPRNHICSQRAIDMMDQSNSHGTTFPNRKKLDCNCLLRCDKLDFLFLPTNGPLTVFKKTRYSQKFVDENFARLILYFDSATFYKIRKMPLYNFTDLMAYTGGLLGLFIGFSFLSVVEILFHMIWLPWKENIMNRSKKIEAKENQIETPEEPPLYQFVN